MILRWMDRVRSDLKQHQLDHPKLAQNRKAWRKAIMAIDPDRDKIGKGERATVQHNWQCISWPYIDSTKTKIRK